MRPLVPLFLLAPLAALLAGCADPVQPSDLTTPLAARAAVDPLGKVHPLPRSLEEKVQRVRLDLEARGYEVARGYFTLWGAEQCKYPLHTVGFCYGNNPTAPYVFAVVPQWKDEFVDQRLHHAILAAQRNMSPTYRLGEQEALVVLAELPPPARYFSIATNVFSRHTTLNPGDPIYGKIGSLPTLQKILFAASPNPDRLMMLASIGNTTNNVVMERRGESPWGQERHFVITPDAGVAEAMTAALLRAGVPSAEHVFTEPVAPALVRVGLGREADDLYTYVRYAMPTDGAAGEEWRETLPLTILRVRTRRDAGPTQPLPVPAYEARTWHRNEVEELGQDLGRLVNAVRARWGQPGATAAPSISAYTFLDLVGQHCLGYPNPARGPMNCLADNQDTDYQITLPPLHIDNGEVIAAVGTLATATGNATYVSLGVNRFPALVGVANLSDVDLDGTAASFQGALQHDAGLFYVHYIARDCTGLHPCLQLSRKLFPEGETLKLMQRNYVTPGSAVGPRSDKVLNPIAIILDGRSRPSSH